MLNLRLVLVTLLASTSAQAAIPDAAPTDPAQYVGTIDNPWFPLKPGTTLTYEGSKDDRRAAREFEVTTRTKTIAGVTCLVVEDRVTLGGKPAEKTIGYYAQDRAGNVWYFGEHSEQISDGVIVGLEGSFVSGEDGAKPGIVMKGQPAVGDFYRQEFLLKDAEDIAEVISLNENVTVPAGSFSNCLKTEETSPLEPGTLEHKFYANGVGNILTVDEVTGERLELVRVTH